MPSHASFRLAVLLLCLRGLCLGQSTALLTGSVSDPSGGVIAAARVLCSNTETDSQVTALTNAGGLFRFPDLPVGPHELTVSREGFASLVRRGIRQYTGQTVERLRAELRVESFNALNHPNLNLFYSAGSYVALENVTSPTFGQIAYAQDPRLMQIALKLRF